MMCLANDILIQNARRMEHPAAFGILHTHKPEWVDEKRCDHDCGNERPRRASDLRLRSRLCF
jgi:hypothetical protein